MRCVVKPARWLKSFVGIPGRQSGRVGLSIDGQSLDGHRKAETKEKTKAPPFAKSAQDGAHERQGTWFEACLPRVGPYREGPCHLREGRAEMVTEIF